MGTIKDFLLDLNEFYGNLDDASPYDALMNDYEATVVEQEKKIEVLGMTVVRDESGDWVLSMEDIERHIDVTISDETKEPERPGYDVDVYATYESDGDSGERIENELNRTCATLEEAWAYIRTLQEKYIVKLMVSDELHL